MLHLNLTIQVATVISVNDLAIVAACLIVVGRYENAKRDKARCVSGIANGPGCVGRSRLRSSSGSWSATWLTGKTCTFRIEPSRRVLVRFRSLPFYYPFYYYYVVTIIILLTIKHILLSHIRNDKWMPITWTDYNVVNFLIFLNYRCAIFFKIFIIKLHHKNLFIIDCTVNY